MLVKRNLMLRYGILPGTSIPCPSGSIILGKSAVPDLPLPFPVVKLEKIAKSFAVSFWYDQSSGMIGTSNAIIPFLLPALGSGQSFGAASFGNRANTAKI